MQILPNGAQLIPEYLDREAQERIVELIRQIVRQAPLFTPRMPRTGRKMHVRMTNCGKLGWVTDKEQGYRYQETHPVTAKAWPAIPDPLLEIWEAVSNYPQMPEACLINYYDPKARMGLHQDRDEKNFEAPVVSISLGNSCLFRIGQGTRGGKTTSFKLNSGDVFVLGGKARLAYHGVDRIYPGTSTLLKNGGRINLTLRRVTAGRNQANSQTPERHSLNHVIGAFS